VVRRPRQPQMVSQPGHRAHRRGASGIAEDAVPQAHGGSEVHPPRVPRRGERRIALGKLTSTCASIGNFRNGGQPPEAGQMPYHRESALRARVNYGRTRLKATPMGWVLGFSSSGLKSRRSALSSPGVKVTGAPKRLSCSWNSGSRQARLRPSKRNAHAWFALQHDDQPCQAAAQEQERAGLGSRANRCLFLIGEVVRLEGEGAGVKKFN